MVRWFFPGFSGLRLPLMYNGRDISEIFLKGSKKKKKKKDMFSIVITLLEKESFFYICFFFSSCQGFILRGDLFYVLPCVILFLCFSVLLALRLSRLGKTELILVLFVRLFDLRLFGFVCFLFRLVSGKCCGL